MQYCSRGDALFPHPVPATIRFVLEREIVMTDFDTTEQFAALNKANLENLVGIANSTVARAEHLTALNVHTACAMLEDGVAATKSLMAVKDAQKLADLQARLTQPMIDKTMSYTRGVCEIASQGQQEFAQRFENQLAELNKTFRTALEQVVKAAPAGSDVMVAAIKSSVETASSLYDNVAKVAKQATEANISALTTTAQAVTSKKGA